MKKQHFNPLDWLAKPKSNEIELSIPTVNDYHSDVERIIEQIENKQIDIATTYADWRNIGFAFADEFGEGGRDMFHRISCFYSDYNKKECDVQFDHCLKAKGGGVSLKTFFYHAKQSGVKLALPVQKKKEQDEVPTLPDTIFNEIPLFLQKVVKIATSKEERDILFLGSIVTLSACFPKLFGIYDGKKVFSNLFLFVTAQASAGKGRLVHCKQLVKPIHKQLREYAAKLKQEYEVELAEYNNQKKGNENPKEKPSKPPEKMLFIPANNSTTGVFQLLSDSEGKGLIFETEGDTLAHAFKTDYGNYSDGFRKAFHHETISYYRRTDREYVDIDNPCISTVLSGTPKQVGSLIPNAENGLFSRFIFYYMNVQPIWKDVFADNTEGGLDEYFDVLGAEFHELYKVLLANQEIHFELTLDQKQQFNQLFTEIQQRYLGLQGNDYMATVRRLGLIAFRISMILSALRIMETGDISSTIVCEDKDFQAALEIVKVLVKHSSKVFSELPEETNLPKRQNRKEKFLGLLPVSFNRQKYLEVARSLSISDKTAEGYITDFCKHNLLHREHQDKYINNSIKENEEVKEVED